MADIEYLRSSPRFSEISPEDDLGDLFAIKCRAHTAFWGNRLDRNDEYLLEYLRERIESGILIVARNGSSKGIISATCTQGGPSYMDTFFVSPEERGLGLGRELHALYVEELKAIGCPCIRTVVQSCSQVADVLQDKFGYRVRKMKSYTTYLELSL